MAIANVLAVMASGHDAAEGEKVLRAEIRRMADAKISSAELEKAKNLLITDELRGRETNDGVAFALGEAIVLEGDPGAVNSGLARLQAVTAADVQRVMRKYVRNAKPVVVTYRGQEAAQ